MVQPLVIGYSLLARFFHWLTAALIFIAVPLAVLAVNAPPGPEKANLFFWHKAFGISVLIVVALRALQRLINGTPGPHPQLPHIEKIGSEAVHILLYVLLLVVPLLGWAASSALGHPPSFFGFFTLPAILPPDKALGEKLFDIHVVLAFLLAGLAAFHIMFAIYHGLVRQDGVMTRMVSGTNRGSGHA